MSVHPDVAAGAHGVQPPKPVDGIHCADCGAHFRAPPSEFAPVVHACGHSACGECDTAQKAVPPFCCVCKCDTGVGTVNAALAAYGEACFVGRWCAAGQRRRRRRHQSPCTAPHALLMTPLRMWKQ